LILEFAVLNPGGRDSTRLFPKGAGHSDDAGHPPVNYHAYAACLRGGYFREVNELPPTVRNVLVLLRRNGLSDALRALSLLRKREISPWISWKESGLHQVAEALSDARRWAAFRALAAAADGFVSSTPDLVPLYRAAGCPRGGFVPTPYPVGEPGWDFTRTPTERNGIFVGTREFDVPSRNHALALATVASLGCAVTVVNPGGARAAGVLQALGISQLTIIPKRLAFPDYLRVVASHRMVFQLDRSAVPGQVAGDALLCGVPCVGGDGAVDRLVFPDLCGHGRSIEEVQQRARDVLEGGKHMTHAAAVSFPTVASELTALLAPT